MEKKAAQTSREETALSLLRRHALPVAAGVGGLLFVAGYVTVAVHGRNTVASGTTVAGHSVSGLTQPEAAQVLAHITHPEASKPVRIAADGHTISMNPGASFHVDAKKTLSGHVGFSLNPVSVWRHAFGAGEVRPTFVADQSDLAQRISTAAAKAIPGAPRQGRVVFLNGQVVQRDGAPGRSVDAKKLAGQMATSWPSQTSYSSSLTTVQPDATDATLKTFARGDAQHAMSSPLTLKSAKKTLTIQPSDVSDFISTAVTNGQPHIAVDSAALERFILSRTSDFIEAPVDSKILWNKGKASASASQDGRKLDTPKLASAVATALVGNHVAQVPTVTDPAKVTQKNIDLGSVPTTSITKFTSAFPLGASQNSRIHNITTAMHRIDGTYVLPGQQFSLLRTLGYDLSKKRGYVAAGTLQNGMHVDGMGGGVSQVSTVMYNTAFFAGVQLDRHTPHAVWISRYPMGREATLWNPSIDNTWTNNTGQPILIRTHVANGQVSMEFFGQRKYDVTTKTSDKYHITQPKHRVVRGVKGCESSLGNGVPGFSVDVWRKLSSGGQPVKTEKVHTTYAADDVIVCR